ncbi:hypothetical protein HPB49_024222 [Dermacentor silvarum]|uniref:Uncharacterized protein n=1 Tax=Dermacentor silvarum TaxID=543639 RepID=A0ACB8D0U5_DERSI|nr:hypothetical protein HPB49_024222 [Dermacentor silvarum]
MSSSFISALVLLLSLAHSLERCGAECRPEYQKLSKGGVTHTACKAANPRCRIIERGLRAGEAEEILRLHNAYRSQMALGRVPGFKPAANMHQLVSYMHSLRRRFNGLPCQANASPESFRLHVLLSVN